MTLKLSKPNLGVDEIDAVTEVLRSGNLVYGAKGREFEASLEQFIKVGSARVVSSGTSALYIALKALGVDKGDAVVVPGFTFPATMNAVAICGAVPIICDVDQKTYCASPESIRRAIQCWQGPEKIKVIMPVHEFGYPADMPKIMEIANEYGLYVVEDAACAIGASLDGKHLGTFGDIGCFSFHPRKVLTTGEGGAVVTSSQALREKIDLLRNHGIHYSNNKPSFEISALNFRLTDIQSAIGIVQLAKISDAVRLRRTLANRYQELLEGHRMLSTPLKHDGHNWQTFMVVLGCKVERDSVIQALHDQGIETNLGAQALSQLPCFSVYAKHNRQTPTAERLYRSGLALPLSEQYSLDDVEMVVDRLLSVL